MARAVAANAPAAHAIALKSRREVDISDQAAVARELKNTGVDWIVNGAAFTAVDSAEERESEARLVNQQAVGILSRAATRFGCRLLHLSTDFVFDGRSNRAYLPLDATNPLSVYGVTKLAGEHEVLNFSDGIVLRTSWVYAAYGKNFVLTMLKLMREKDGLRVVCDQIGVPTYAGGAARAIWRLIEVDAPSAIYHWTDLGVATWYDFAVAIQEEAHELGLLDHLIPIEPIPTSEFPTRARRPAFSVLNTEETRFLTGVPAKHWRYNLRIMLNELRTA